MDELELGSRVASRIGNEQDGWGAWINPRIFEINYDPIALNADWGRNAHTRNDPWFDRPRAPRRSGVVNPKPTAENPIFFPGQREPSEPSTKRR